MTDLQMMGRWGAALLESVGLETSSIQATIRCLEFAESRGLSSHGYVRLPTYIARIRAGGIEMAPKISVISDRPALSVVDADAAIGARSAEDCVELVMNKARANGIGLVIARNANHFGAAGYYTNLMAAQGFFGVAICNTDSVMSAPAGGRPILGSNPISISVPGSGTDGPLLDMATTEVSQGKIIVARDRGESIPFGWAVDQEGLPTQDPISALSGALLPSGGPKGFGLAFMVDCLVAIGGAETSQRVSPLYGDPAATQGLGHAFMAIAIDTAITRDEYATRVGWLTGAVHESGLPGVAQRPIVPGERELMVLSRVDEWRADPSTISQFEDLSRELAVPIPQ